MTQKINTAALANSAVTNEKVAQSSLNLDRVNVGAGGFTFRNKIINGKMEITQRGTSFAAASGYTLDRWAMGGTGTDVFTIIRANASVAAGDIRVLRHRIEGFNARDLRQRTFTLSFWVRSSLTGIHCVAIRAGDNAGSATLSFVSEYTINSANTWEFKTITVQGGIPQIVPNANWETGIGLDVAFCLMSGSNFRTSPNSWQTGSFFATANQVNVQGTVGNIFAITGVQLEVGSVATPFEHRPIGVELALCQRYYEFTTVSVITGAASQTMVMTRGFSQPKRSLPTLTPTAHFAANVSTIGFSTLNLDAFRAVLGATAGGAAEWTGAVAAASEL